MPIIPRLCGAVHRPRLGAGVVVTVMGLLPERFWNAAEIVALPAPTAVTIPVALTVAIAVFDDFHLAVCVTSCVVAPPYEAVALNCWVDPVCMAQLAGVTETTVNVAAMVVSELLPEIP